MEERFISECEECDTIVHILNRLKHHIVEAIVSGGWLFTGKLVEVEDEQVILCDVTVTSSGGLTLSTFEVHRVAICLDAITSIGKPDLIVW